MTVKSSVARPPEASVPYAKHDRALAAGVRALRGRPANRDFKSGACRPIDLTEVPQVEWAWVDEHVYAAIRGCSVKVLQRERQLNIGCPFRKINGTTIRYKIGDITSFMESQPGGGPSVSPQPRRGRPRKSST
jgi:hypothetical protein